VFDRWVLTAETVCFTESFHPEGDGKKGQPMGKISFGSGDFSLFTEPESEYLYLFYNIIHADTDLARWTSCDIYVARTRKRRDGVMGDSVKYYNGAFCEAGNLGKESPIVLGGWHPKVVSLKQYGKYLMSSSLTRPKPNGGMVNPVMELRESDDLIHWSEPTCVMREGEPFGGHYAGFYSEAASGDPFVIEGDTMTVLRNGNGTDVTACRAIIETI
jgi:hypothetical protein